MNRHGYGSPRTSQCAGERARVLLALRRANPVMALECVWSRVPERRVHVGLEPRKSGFDSR